MRACGGWWSSGRAAPARRPSRPSSADGGACPSSTSISTSGTPAGWKRRATSGARCSGSCSRATNGSRTATTARRSTSGSPAPTPSCSATSPRGARWRAPSGVPSPTTGVRCKPLVVPNASIRSSSGGSPVIAPAAGRASCRRSRNSRPPPTCTCCATARGARVPHDVIARLMLSETCSVTDGVASIGDNDGEVEPAPERSCDTTEKFDDDRSGLHGSIAGR